MPEIGPDVGRRVLPEIGPDVGRRVLPEIGPDVGRRVLPEIGQGCGRRVLPEIGPGVRFFEKPAGCGEFRKVDFADGRSISSKTLGPVKNPENEIG